MSQIQLFENAPTEPVPLSQVAIVLHPDDDIAIAKVPLMADTMLIHDAESAKESQITVQQTVVNGHKMALREIAQDEPVRRYGQVIGFATQAIMPGDHVHIHNLGVQAFNREHTFSVEINPVDYIPEAKRQTFMGYGRESGRVGTRNYIAVLSSVNCSAHTTREIAHYFTPERLSAFPNVDGVIPIAHSLGCASRVGGVGYEILQRTLVGFATHPNVAAAVWVGLGCETNQIDAIMENYSLHANGNAMTIQDAGGIRKTIEAGIRAVEELLPLANENKRTEHPISELMLALQCGGSDSWSGVTANPLVGHVADELVRQGGTVVLGETPEVYGAEHLLTRRAIRPEVGQALVDKIEWWENYTRIHDMEIDNNPTPGNKLGGLTTIYEKSLGAIAKGGSTPLTGVYDYAMPVTERGFTMMDTPGYDPVSVTGQVAGGCNVVLFTTGRGSAFGFKPAPSIKISTNTQIYEHMIEDMDFNGGAILDGLDVQEAIREFLNLIIDVASGQPSKSEAQGIGEHEFNPWHIGATM